MLLPPLLRRLSRGAFRFCAHREGPNPAQSSHRKSGERRPLGELATSRVRPEPQPRYRAAPGQADQIKERQRHLAPVREIDNRKARSARAAAAAILTLSQGEKPYWARELS